MAVGIADGLNPEARFEDYFDLKIFMISVEQDDNP